jgi:exonuclease III
MLEQPTLRILQYNIRKEAGTIIALLEDSNTQSIDIIAVQEPNFTAFNQTATNPRTSQFHLAYQAFPEQRTRVCFYINKRLDPDSWSSQYQGPDICSLTLTLQDQQAIDIHNIYNPSPNRVDQTNLSSLPRIPDILGGQSEQILLGDFNLHHPVWNNIGRTTYDQEADQLLQTTRSKEMTLLLPENSVTWRMGELESAIDLIFTTPQLTERLQKCRIAPELQFGSDHLPILSEFDIESAIEEEQLTRRRAWKSADTEAIKIKARGLNLSLSEFEAGARTALLTPEQIDSYIQRLLQGLQEIVQHTVPWARPGKGKSYWNQACTYITQEVKRLAKQYRGDRRQETEQVWRQAIQIRNKTLQKARTLDFRTQVDKAAKSERGIWSLAKWAKTDSRKPKVLPQFPVLQRGDGGLARTVEEKMATLRETFFPAPIEADLSDIPAQESPRTGNLIDLTENEIYKAIYRPKQDKAPGIDGLPNRFLRIIANPLILRLKYLFEACLNTGYHPKEFKKANTIILKKPRKADYTQPKAYRPIALLSTLGKALESIVAKRLSDYAEENSLLPPEQMGARRNRSTETALETITEAIYTIWDCGKQNIASLLSLDVAGAFDNVSHQRLLYNLRSKRTPDYIVQWTKSFLQDRSTAITLGKKTSAIETVLTGIPQGSPISPMLFLFFNGPLIESCRQSNLPLQIGGFVDDIHLLAYGKNTNITCETLQKAHKLCAKWAKTHGAVFAPQKYELIHLTRTRRFNLEKTLDLGDITIEPRPAIQVLGLLIDSKLNWGPYIKKVQAKMIQQSYALEIIAASIWGASLTKARQIYTSMIRPAMSYAAAIWYIPKGLRGIGFRNPMNHLHTLEIIQNQGLRRVLGAFKATPIPVLEAEAAVQPIGIWLEQAVLSYQLTKGIHPITKISNRRIRAILSPDRGPPMRAGKTPMQKKQDWAYIQIEQSTAEENNRGKQRQKVREWGLAQWAGQWADYQRKVLVKTPAQVGSIGHQRLDIHRNLAKAESSVLTQIRTEKIGLAAFLFQRQVPDIASARCPCGWRQQTATHVAIFCPNHQEHRQSLFQKAGTTNFKEIVSTARGAKAIARWFIQTDLLPQFSLAKEQLYRPSL